MRIKILLSVLAVSAILLSACAGPSTPTAEIEVVSLDIAPPEVISGEMVSITAEVRNAGTSQGTYTAVLTVDGVDVETKGVIVASEATANVTFSLVKDKTGSYQVGVGGLLATLTIKEKPVAKEVELKYDNGTVDKPRFAGPDGGYLVHFSPPSVPFAVKKVKIYGVLFGTSGEESDFEVQIWDKNHKALWSENYSFALFPIGSLEQGEWGEWRKTIDWVELEVSDVKVTDEFYVHVWTDDSARFPVHWGIGVGYTSGVNEYCEQTKGYEIVQRPADSIWMIRVVGTGIE